MFKVINKGTKTTSLKFQFEMVVEEQTCTNETKKNK